MLIQVLSVSLYSIALVSTPAPCFETPTLLRALERSVPVPQPEPEQGIFPPVRGDLDLAWDTSEQAPSLMALLKRYGELTGQGMLLNRETRQILEHLPVPLERPMKVPAAEVQCFVETLLAEQFVVTLGPTAGPQMFSVHSLASPARATLLSQAIPIASDRTETMRSHPALMFSTVLELSNVDVRTLSNSLRAILVNSNVMQILPVGGHSLLISGMGPWLADRVDALRALDANSVDATTTVVHELVRLRQADAREVAPQLELALASAHVLRKGSSESVRERRPPGATVLAYERLNALLLTCHQDQLAEALELIALLDAE